MARIRTIKPEFYGSQVVGDDWRSAIYGDFMLYRFYDRTGGLLYIGVTSRPAERFTSHRRKAVWWGKVAGVSAERIQGHRAVLAAERLAIGSERPSFNRRSAA